MSLTAVLGRARCSSAPTVESALAGSLLVATQRTIGSSALAGFLLKGLLLIVRWAAVNGSRGLAGPRRLLTSTVDARCSSARISGLCWVAVDESHGRAGPGQVLISGASGTPYAYGLFEFHVRTRARARAHTRARA